jgi:hypothetical protein
VGNRRLVLTACVAGGLAGLLNAFLCYVGWPQQVEGADLRWHVLPAGLLHGLVLAAVPILGANWSAGQTLSRRLLAVPLVGWCGGYLSWIPLDLSAFRDSPWEALSWPLDAMDSRLSPVMGPLLYFGMASLLLYSWLALRSEGSGPGLHVPAAVAAGVLGSLWWCATIGPWYFSVLHGCLWGGAVGMALWYNSLAGGRRTSGCS